MPGLAVDGVELGRVDTFRVAYALPVKDERICVGNAQLTDQPGFAGRKVEPWKAVNETPKSWPSLGLKPMSVSTKPSEPMIWTA